MEEPFSSKAAELHCFTAGYTAKSLLYLERLSLMGITFSFQNNPLMGIYILLLKVGVAHNET